MDPCIVHVNVAFLSFEQSKAPIAEVRTHLYAQVSIFQGAFNATINLSIARAGREILGTFSIPPRTWCNNKEAPYCVSQCWLTYCKCRSRHRGGQKIAFMLPNRQPNPSRKIEGPLGIIQFFKIRLVFLGMSETMAVELQVSKSTSHESGIQLGHATR